MDNTPEQVKSRPPYIAIGYLILGFIMPFGSFLLVKITLHDNAFDITRGLVVFSVLFGMLYLHRLAVRKSSSSDAPTHILIGMLVFSAQGLFLIPALEKASESSRGISKAVHMQLISDALKKYAAEHEGYLPEAERWQEILIPDYFDENTLSFIKSDIDKYAFNPSLSGKRLEDITPNVILLYEAGFESKASRRSGKVLTVGEWRNSFRVVCVDGTIEHCYSKYGPKELQWE